MHTRVFTTTSAEETRALGARLGRASGRGTVLALVGDLGAGKTCLAQGVGEGLGVGGGVVSPTFILVAEHRSGRLPLVHADLYRLDDAADLEQTGLADALEAGAVVVVEWADKHAGLLPEDHLEARLEHTPEGRRITLRATGPRHTALLEAVCG